LHDGQEGTQGFLKWAWREVFDLGDRAAPHPLRPDRSHVVEALPQIIDGARAAGFEFVPLKDLL